MRKLYALVLFLSVSLGTFGSASVVEATEPSVEAPPEITQSNVQLVPPLAQLQVIFGFYDRRFPGFNGGLEHMGVDFAANAGAPVYAICDGRVMSSNTEYADTASAVMVVDHHCPEPLGRVYAYYGHVNSELMRGQAVIAGAAIGSVRHWPGNGHLHLGLSRQLVDENWGTQPRGVTLQALEEQGWLNPLDYLPVALMPAVAPKPNSGPASKRVLPKPPVYRQNGAGNIPGNRRR